MSGNINQAKEIFMKYNGSHFYMSRGDEYEKYKCFNVTKEQEVVWVKELIFKKIDEINSCALEATSTSNYFIEILSNIREYKIIEFVEIFISLLKNTEIRLDSFSKILIAQEMIETYKSLNYTIEFKNEPEIIRLKINGVRILKDIMNHPITVDKSYRKVGYLKNEIKESTMIQRIQNILEE